MNVSWILLLRLLGVQEERQETREAATTTGACALAAKRAGAVTSHAQAATTRVCTLSAKRAGEATSDGGRDNGKLLDCRKTAAARQVGSSDK
jgi:hypothetical protein